MFYVNAERMKYKKTMTNRMFLLAPMVVIIFSFLAAGIYYFQYSCMYWWYMFLLQGVIAVFCFYSQKMEETSGYQQLIYSLPVDLKKINRAKNMVVLLKMLFLESVLTFLVWLTPILLFPDYQIFSISKLMLGNIIIFLTSAWQIPFCSFLMKKMGKMVPIAIHVVMGIATSTVVGKTAFWIAWPYCWTGREMEYFLGISMSGTPIEKTLTFGVENFVTILLSVLLFFVFMHVDAIGFEKGMN